MLTEIINKNSEICSSEHYAGTQMHKIFVSLVCIKNYNVKPTVLLIKFN